MLSEMNQRRKINRTRNRLKTQTTALNLLLQSLGAVAVGLIMLLHDNVFIARTSQLLLLYFGFVVVLNFLQVLVSASKGVRPCLRSLGRFVITCVVVFVLWHNIQDMFVVIPLALSLWLMLLSISSFISYAQYRDEKETASFHYFLGGVINIGFAMLFILQTTDPVSDSIHILGVYCILLGGSLFLDFLSVAIPSHYLNRLKHSVRIAPPVFLTVMLPQAMLNGVNEFFKEKRDDTRDDTMPFKAENSPSDLAGEAVNVEVFIHVSKSLAGTAGHVDLAVDGTIYCYGAYDKQQSKKYGGVAGEGVVYKVHDKQAYLQFCKTLNHETLFGFGLVLSGGELAQMKAALAQAMERTYPWRCPSQQAACGERPEPPESFLDFPSRLANKVDVTFYKFKRGSYKHYWMLGTNCVTFADDLLKASGMKTLITGIITPGTYYTFLNAEFLKGSSVVVKREVYNKAIDYNRAD